MKVSSMVRVSLLAAISLVLMFFPKFPFPFIFFIDLDLADLPALIASIAMGPVFGVVVELFKNLLYLVIKGSSSGGVGEFANFIMGSALVLPVGILMKNNKSNIKLIQGLILGTILMAIIASFLNYFVLIPVYTNLFFDGNIENILGAVSSSNSYVSGKLSLIIFGVLPANIIKASVVSITSVALYKLLGPQLMKLNIMK